MKINAFILLIFVFTLSCKQKNTTENKQVKDTFYPYTQSFNNYLQFYPNSDLLIERSDSLCTIHYLEFKKDSLILKPKKLLLPTFEKDFVKLNNELIVLSTTPKTLGKNKKSTDFIHQYDENFNQRLEKDMDISKFPNGNCFLLKHADKMFYITDGFKFQENRSLVVSEIDKDFNTLNQKVIKSQEYAFEYNPIKCQLINNLGLVVVSDITNNDTKKRVFRIDVLDFDLKLKWSEDIAADKIIHLGYATTQEKIFIVSSEKEINSVQYWNYLGDKLPVNYNVKKNLLSATSMGNEIYLILNDSLQNTLVKLTNKGNYVNQTKTILKVKATENDVNTLCYRSKQLYWIQINQQQKKLTVNRLNVDTNQQQH